MLPGAKAIAAMVGKVVTFQMYFAGRAHRTFRQIVHGVSMREVHYESKFLTSFSGGKPSTEVGKSLEVGGGLQSIQDSV